jgi:hypothetical protein
VLHETEADPAKSDEHTTDDPTETLPTEDRTGDR